MWGGVVELRLAGRMLNVDVFIVRPNIQVAWRIDNFQIARACLQGTGELRQSRVRAVRDEPYALGHFLRTTGSYKLSFNREAAAAFRHFDAFSPPGALAVSLRV